MEKPIDPAHEIGENVTITDRTQLLSMTPEQAIKIKSLRIENQVIDDEVSVHAAIFDGKTEHVYFVDCSFLDDGMRILREFPLVSKVGFIRCNLSYDALEKLLSSNDPYNDIEILDLTGNELAKEPKRFVDILKHVVIPFKSIGELILMDNGFDSAMIPMIRKVAGTTIGEIYL